MMSSKEEIKINRNLNDVWNFVGNPELFATVFTGVSEIKRKSPEKEGPEQVIVRGSLEGYGFSSSLAVQARDEANKKITYISGRSKVDISLAPNNNGTIIELTIYAFMQSRLLMDLYAKSLKKRILQILEAK